MNKNEKKEMALLDKAIRTAAKAHKGQVDKSKVTYMLHPLRLMAKMETVTEKIVAVLHDVIEDNKKYSLKKLKKKGFPAEVIEALDCLTKRKGELYEPFIGRVKKNKLATKVKIADLEDNMDTRRLPKLTGKDLERLAKYHRARRRLLRAK